MPLDHVAILLFVTFLLFITFLILVMNLMNVPLRQGDRNLCPRPMGVLQNPDDVFRKSGTAVPDEWPGWAAPLAQ